MKSTILRSLAAAIAFVGAMALATQSMAAMVNFKASLSGKSDVPTNKTAGTGSVTAILDTDSKKLTWKGSYSGLSRPGYRRPLPRACAGGQERRCDGSDQPERALFFEGSVTLNDAQADALDGRRHVRQRPHRGQQRRRNPRPN